MSSKTALLSLVKALQWKQVRESLTKSPELIGIRDKKGRTWLHLCCGVDIRRHVASGARDSIRLADILMDAGLGINDAAFTEGTWKATPLWYAVAFGRNLGLARHLLSRGSDPNHCLWAAVYNNDNAAIRLLLENGAAIDPETEDSTPFLGAVQWSRFDAALELLKLGANPNYQNSKGNTALHLMLKKDSDKKHFRMILDYGARLDIPNAMGITAASIMARKRDPDFRAMAERQERKIERS